jgi:hypothetical protein
MRFVVRLCLLTDWGIYIDAKRFAQAAKALATVYRMADGQKEIP